MWITLSNLDIREITRKQSVFFENCCMGTRAVVCKLVWNMNLKKKKSNKKKKRIIVQFRSIRMKVLNIIIQSDFSGHHADRFFCIFSSVPIFSLRVTATFSDTYSMYSVGDLLIFFLKLASYYVIKPCNSDVFVLSVYFVWHK